MHLEGWLYAVMMGPAYEFAPLVALPGWRFAELIEVEVARGLPIDSVSIARIEGEHPVFGFRRQYLLPRLVQRSDDGVIRLRYGYPAAGLYELRRMDRGIAARRAILIDEWRQIFEIPWDVLELLAPVLEQARGCSPVVAETTGVD